VVYGVWGLALRISESIALGELELTPGDGGYVLSRRGLALPNGFCLVSVNAELTLDRAGSMI
jgi:hypothetical protein